MHRLLRSIESPRLTKGLCRTLGGVFFAAALFGILATASDAASLEEIKKRGYMVVATEDNYPPFEFIQDGQPAGLDHDLYKLLKEWTG
jgi:ABC-type amino acid transport substrate-binding protein